MNALDRNLGTINNTNMMVFGGKLTIAPVIITANALI
jgi:hypothetical protein